MQSFIQIQTTCDDRQVLEAIAQELVGRQLAACVQISSPVTSFFRWENKVDNSQEYVCVIKTRAELFDQVTALICELHSYDLPQVIALPIVLATEEFANWMSSEMETPS